MTDKELIASLKRLKVQTGSLVCLGCGREHNCGIHGCAILRGPSPLWKRSWRRTNPAA